MRVLHAYRDMLSKGGRPDDSRSLISAISALGHETAVVTYAPPGGAEPIHPASDVQVLYVPTGLATARAFGKVLDEFRPDVVHFTGGPRLPSQILWAIEARKRKIPYFASGCGNLSDDTIRYRWGTKKNRFYHVYAKRINHVLLDRPFLRAAAGVHAGSPTEADLALAAGARSAVVAPFGVKVEWIANARRERTLHHPVVFAYLGRLSIHHKGLDLIVEGFGKVVEAGHGGRFRLVLAGTDENGSMDTLRRRADEVGIRDVVFPGGVWADGKQKLWDETDYFLHMCRYNGFALSVREAIGQGLPIIASRESDLGDWAESENMGLVAQLTPESVAQAVIAAMETKASVYSTMSTNARSFAEASIWANTARACVEAYGRHVRRD